MGKIGEKLYMTRQDPYLSTKIVFFRPQGRTLTDRIKRLILRLLRQRYSHVALEVQLDATKLRSGGLVLDLSKDKGLVGYHSHDMRAAVDAMHDVAIVVDGPEVLTSHIDETIAAYKTQRVERWGSVQYLFGWRDYPINCATFVGRIVGIYGRTPDELFEELFQHHE